MFPLLANSLLFVVLWGSLLCDRRPERTERTPVYPTSPLGALWVAFLMSVISWMSGFFIQDVIHGILFCP